MTLDQADHGVLDDELDVVLDLRRPDPFTKAFDYSAADAHRSAGVYPYYRRPEGVEGVHGRFDGRPVVLFSSNDYLGLGSHPRIREAAAAATRRYGVSSGSRLLSGTLPVHRELEDRLADWLGVADVLTFSSAMGANQGFLSALVGRHDSVYVDKLAHASIQAGARIPTSAGVRRFRHNDPDDLAARLEADPHDVGAVVAVDGVYSMAGDVADLAGLVAVCRTAGARLAVDDAHGLGVLGGGRGTAHELGLAHEIDLHTGTFSKAMGSTGGYVAGDLAVIDFLRHNALSIVFSVGLPPGSAAAADQALQIVASEPERVSTARHNGDRLRSGLTEAGFDIGGSTTSIVPLLVGDDMETFNFWKASVDAGVHANPVVSPAVAKGHGILRLTATAAHDDADVDRAVETLAEVGRRRGLVG
jgi:8-amino-7-oxononanoate synthase